jgi:hypothetical protein
VPIPLQTAVISAVTAAAVTLILDVLIRPYLEVRKDRIVSTARDKRELATGLRDLHSEILHATLYCSTNKDKLRQVADRISGQLSKIYSLNYSTRITDVCSQLLLTVRGELIGTVHVIEVFEKNAREEHKKALEKAVIDPLGHQLIVRGEQLASVLRLVHQIIFSNAWVIRRRSRLMKQAESYLARQPGLEDIIGRPDAAAQSSENDHPS